MQQIPEFHENPVMRFFINDVRDRERLRMAMRDKESPVEQGFEYDSSTNSHFLDQDEIRDSNVLCGM